VVQSRKKPDPLGDFLRTIRGNRAAALRPDDDPARLEEPEHAKGWHIPGLAWVPPVARARETVYSLAAARDYMTEAVSAYLNTQAQGVLLVVAPPGVGKTRLGVRTADALAEQERQVTVLGPRHDHYQTMLAESLSPDRWYEWLPRQLGDDSAGKPETCRYDPYMRIYQNRGFDSLTFCKGVCTWAYINNGCPWHGQKDFVARAKKRVVFGQHSHLFLGLPVPCSVAIGDELPINAALRIWQIPPSFVVPTGLPYDDPMTELMHVLHKLVLDKQRISGAALINALGGPESVIESLDLNYSTPSGEIHSPHEVDDLEYNHMPALSMLLRREAEYMVERPGVPYTPRVETSELGLTLYLRHSVQWRSPLAKDGWPEHMIWLDGTGNERFYEMIFERPVQVVAPVVQGAMFITQYHNRANGKTTLIGAGRDDDLLDEKEMPSSESNAMRRRQGTLAAITFKALEEEMSEVVSRDASGAPLVGHFYAERGSNRFKDVTDIAAAGKPQPDPWTLYNIVRCLRPERMDPILQDGKVPWVEKVIAYDHVDAKTGMSPAVAVNGPWGDPDLESIYYQLVEAEIIQSIKRGRDVLRSADKPLHVHLFTNLPIRALPPNRVLGIHELFEDAIPGIDVFDWPRVRQYLESAYATGDLVSARRMASDLGIKESTARKHLLAVSKAMAPDGELAAVSTTLWSRRRVFERLKGRPPLELVPYYPDDTEARLQVAGLLPPPPPPPEPPDDVDFVIDLGDLPL
jgi:hypothetical protein